LILLVLLLLASLAPLEAESFIMRTKTFERNELRSLYDVKVRSCLEMPERYTIRCGKLTYAR
jgi:hypothetical protein